MSTLLRTEGISKRFSGLLAVSEVSIDIRPAEIFGVIGPNGAGKTTLFNVVSGVTPPTTGRVYLDDEDVTGLPIDKIARRGLVRTFQRSLPFESLTILDNLMVATYAFDGSGLRDLPRRWLGLHRGERRNGEKAAELLALAGLSGRAKALAGSLSHGDRRQLEIVRALMCAPRILLLDEPAAGLSADEIGRLGELLRALRSRGQTVVIIEHNLSMVMKVCDRIAVLDRGSKIAQATPVEIQRDQRVIEAYLGRKKIHA